MDLTYLLWLQDFRNAIDNALTPFMEGVSLFGVHEILLLPVFVYWCLDKRKGLFSFFALKISHTINSIVKLTACIYRPWIREPKIIPAGDSIKTAGGYSFPSGHTMMSVPIYGTLAVSFANKFLRLIFVLAIFLTMFSRNYLGVHTPQDVLVGLVLGISAIYIAQKVLDYLDKHPEKDSLVMLICGAAGILTLIYVTYKPYPMDYVDGKLLVDPVKMQIDAWGDSGGLTAFALMWYIESRFVKFTPTGWNVKGVIFCVLGLIPIYWAVNNLNRTMAVFIGPHYGKLAGQTILYFYIMVLWPSVLKIVKKFEKQKS